MRRWIPGALVFAALAVLPLTAHAQTATVCGGRICFDWYDESHNAPTVANPSRYAQGWLVMRNTATGDYGEFWLLFDADDGWIDIRDARAWRGDSRYYGETPVDDRMWGNVRCDDMQGQNDRFRDHLTTVSRDAIARLIGGGAGSWIGGRFAWQAVLGAAVGPMIYEMTFDFFGYFGRCYLR